MQPLPSQRSSKKWWPWLLVLAVLVLLAGGYWWWQQSRSTPTPDTDTPAPTTDKTKLPDNPGPASSDQVPQKEGVAVTITKLEQKNDEVIIEGTVTGATEGTCVAEFTTPNDLPVVIEAKAIKDGDGAKCGPLKHPAADFAYLGEWQVVLKVYTGGGRAESTSQKITIK